jgi:predicted N-acetyltransferase YhbS
VGEYTFTPLAPTHNVGAFSCGHAEIDDYLHNRAAAEQALNLSQIYVLANDALHVCAYGTLSPLSIRIDAALLQALNLTGVPYSALGGYLLGRLGVGVALQNQGIGPSVVVRLAQIAARQREITGGVYLAVDPKEAWLIHWYEKLGFRRINPKQSRLVLPLAAIP